MSYNWQSRKTDEPPGPISNASLLEEDMQSLKKNRKEHDHYDILSATEWNALWKWYGGPGPAIPRIVKKHKHQLLIEARPLTLKLVSSSDLTKLVEYETSKLTSLHELKVKMCEIFGCKYEDNRLWDYHSMK